ncbi:MAG: hypothetical protein KF858_01980 [Candidatus Sumerlaeia bacterium]|nr:hypothetical protein [Candidatus Sumerlaeia bacterium]
MSTTAKRLSRILPLLGLALASSGCIAIGMGPKHFQNKLSFEAGIGGYASMREIRKYDGEILQIDIASNRQQNGELLNVDVWPLVGVGLGPLGVRAHLTFFGAGIGSLFYVPESVGGSPEKDASFSWP